MNRLERSARTRVLTLSIALAIGGLAGCGSGDDATSSTDVDEPAPETDVAGEGTPSLPNPGSPAEAPTSPPSGGAIGTAEELNVGVDFTAGAGVQMDPAKYRANANMRAIHSALYDTMFYMGSGGELEPGLATAWATPDAQTLVLTLREGVRFHDGTDLDAEAVKFSWERFLADEDGVKNAETNAIESIGVLGPHQLEVTFSAPVLAGWIERMLIEAHSGLGVVSPSAAESLGNDAFSDQPVGAGPYVFDAYQTDQVISLVKNDDHWNADNYHFARINFIQTAPGSATVNALAAGTIDLATVGATDIDAILSNDGLAAYTSPSPQQLQLWICATRPPFDSVDARKAVQSAVDPTAINAAIYGDRGVVNGLPIPSTYAAWSAELAEQVPPPDVDVAKRLADESGLSGSTVDMLYWSVAPELEGVATIVQSQLAEIGLTVNLTPEQNPPEDMPREQPDLELSVVHPATQANYVNPGGLLNPCGNDAVLPGYAEAYSGSRDATVADDQRQTAADAYMSQNMELVPWVPLLDVPLITAASEAIHGLQRSDGFMPVTNRWVNFAGIYSD